MSKASSHTCLIDQAMVSWNANALTPAGGRMSQLAGSFAEVRAHKIAVPSGVMNQIVRELAQDLGDAAYTADVVTHTPTVASSIADVWSRKFSQV